MAVRQKKITSRNIVKIVKELAKIPDETRRFDRLTATTDTLLLVVSTPEVYEMAINMLTGYNRFILEASFETNTKKRYKMVSEVVCELNVLQFAVLPNVFPTREFLLLLKQRCDVCNDNAACIRLDQVIYGEPEAEDDDGEVAQLGMMGLWTLEDNRQAGEILVTLNVITEEEYNRTIAEREGVKVAPPEPPVPAEVPPAPPVEVVTPPPPEPPVPAEVPPEPPVEVVPTPPPEPPVPAEVPPTPPVEDLASMKKSIEERMEKLKQEALIVNLKLQLEEERQKTEELKKRLSQTDGESSLVVKEEITIPPSNTTLVYMQPSDYEKWGFIDFESIIPGLKLEDLQQLYDHVNLSERTTYQEKSDIRALITNRMNEIRVNGL